MKVVVKKSVLDQVINQLAEERGYHSRRIDQIAGEGNPVLPDAQVATQLSQNTVDVEDPDFLPVNKRELSSAASEIANKVSPGKIQKFYAGLKTLLKKTSSPDRQKGMSETDLMEALRPFVVREAMRLADPSVSSAQTYVSTGRGRATQDEPEASTVDTGVRTDVPDAPRPPRRKIIKSLPPGDVEVKDVIVPRPAEALIKRAKKGKKERKGDPGEMSDFEKILGQSQQNMDAIFSSMLKRNAKIYLRDVVAGDVSRFLDAYYEASQAAPKAFPIPKSLKAAEMNVFVSDDMRTIKELGESTPHRIIKFVDESGSDRGIVKQVGSIVHTGGPIAARLEDKFGKSEDIMYYLLYNFPFNESEYKEEFERQLPVQARQRSEDAAARLLARAEKEKDKEEKDLAGDERSIQKEKEARRATTQKLLSLANADELAYQTISAIVELAIQGNDFELEKIFKSLKLPAISADRINSMSEEDKSKLQIQIKNVYDSNRKAFYDISHMDYVRDIIDWESFTSKYSLEDDAIISGDPVARGQDMILQVFFENAFKPRMEAALAEISKQHPKMKKIIPSIYGPRLKDFDSFIKTTDPSAIEDYLNLVNDITKNYIMKNEEVFMKTIPDFYPMLAGVKGKAGTADYDTRLAAIGMGEIGKQREPFEYLRSITATMKAVVASGLLEILEGRKELDKPVLTGDDIRKSFRKQLARARRDQDFAIEMLSNNYLNKILSYAKLNSPHALAYTDVEKAMEELDAAKAFEQVEKAEQAAREAAQKIDLEAQDISQHVEAVVNKFVNKMEEYFKKLGNPGSVTLRPPIYKFIKDYGLSVKMTEDSIAAGTLADLLDQYYDLAMINVEKAQKAEKKQEKKAK